MKELRDSTHQAKVQHNVSMPADRMALLLRVTVWYNTPRSNKNK